MEIRAMTIADYDKVNELWQVTTKRALSNADSRENIEAYLKRNEGMSQVAVDDGKIVGTVLAGHDGRRGFIYHMAVHPDYRRHHIGKKLAMKAIKKIAEDNIDKTNIYCYKDNLTGQSFWASNGFQKREDIFFFSFNSSDLEE